MAGLVVWSVLVALTGVICIVVVCALRRPMDELLKANSYVSPARNFYLRTFTVLVFLAALATVCKTDTPSSDKEFLEYVWWVVAALQTTFWALSFWLIGYVALLTLLFVVLGRYHDQ